MGSVAYFRAKRKYNQIYTILSVWRKAGYIPGLSGVSSIHDIQSTPVISNPNITKYPLIAKCDISSAYNEYTVISKEYTGPLDFDITGVDCTPQVV